MPPIPPGAALRRPKSLASLFDHPVGKRGQLRRKFESEHLCGREIDHQFEFRWLLDRQIGWLCAFQYLVNKHRRFLKDGLVIGP